MNSSDVTDINTLARFVSNDMTDTSFNLSETGSADCLVLCGSAILHCAESVFRAVQSRQVAKTLVICGGIGHSTILLYDAVAAHPQYKALSAEIRGMPESQILHRIGRDFFQLDEYAAKHAIRVIVEDKSTNCGANAIETKKVLDAAGVATPSSLVIVQDPTMSLRTKASFEKTYAGIAMPVCKTCPSFVPQVKLEGTQVVFDNPPDEHLWSMPRFIDLLIGEIPRLRNDSNGYGPSGKGFIVQIDIPDEVEAAWARLTKKVEAGRSTM
ncbi:DUF218 domain protein [Protomyces lactucae-debilis]|uniref:DUF218 domain protein n=1 Tax=Protomyces lactucae-debilis TaxID=2754530 RepID=A0A1Y2F573_PROLT|nr:DUF218 domain protein [Protomyces lactucae-debilis]ORY79009.1 DUF218 domain protein [Protomyces lactucae-debilis]